MRRAKRVVSNTFSFIVLIVLLSGIYVVTKQAVDSIQPKREAQVVATQNNPIPVPVEKPVVNEGLQPVLNKPRVLGSSSGSCGQAWKWPCDASKLSGHFVNGTLINQAGKTIRFNEVLFKKEPPGLEIGASVSTKETPTDDNGTDDKTDDTKYTFGLCLANGEKYESLASIGLSQPLLPDILAGYKLSVQPVAKDVYATIDWDWLNAQTPKDFDKFGSLAKDPVENTLRTMASYNIVSPSNNFGPDFASYVLGRVRLQAPGQNVDFEKEFADDKGVESTTMQVEVENNEAHNEVLKQFREKMIDKGLSGLIASGSGYIGALAFQPKENKVKPVRLSGASVASKGLYNMFMAAPQMNTEDLKKNGKIKVASISESSSTALSITGTTRQDEFERSTIVNALFGGVYYIPTSNIAASGKISMLSYEPKKLDTSKYLCDPNSSPNNCPIIRATSSCSGIFSAEVTVRLRQVVLSADDTESYAGVTNDGVARSKVRAGSMFTRRDKRPNGAIEKASIDELITLTDKASPTCKAVIAQRLPGNKKLTPLEEASVRNHLAEIAFDMQSILVSPINVKYNTWANYKRDPAVMRAILAIFPGFFGNEKDPEYAVEKITGEAIKPALISFDSHILYPGSQLANPNTENAKNLQSILDDFLKKQNIQKMTDAKVSCNVGGEYWLCSDSGNILPKCN